MRARPMLGWGGILLGAAVGLAAEGGWTAELRADRLILTAAGRPFAHYVFSDPAVRRPYFAHVRAPGGVPVTRTHPPVAGTDATDHAAMHPGVWLAFGDVNGEDFWRNRGTIRHERFTRPPQAAGDRLEFATAETLVTRDGTVLGGLDSEFTLLLLDGGVRLDWTVVATAAAGELVFGDQEEMGFGVRVATPLTEKNGGRVRTSAGVEGAVRAWGRTADWCDYGAERDGRVAGVAVLADPANFRPSWIHCRDYGLVVANPFGRRAFTGSPEPSRIVVTAGAPLRLRFAAFVYAAPASRPPDLAAVFRGFAGRER